MVRRSLKERRLMIITVTSSTKLICSRQKYQQSLKIAEYPLHQLMRQGRSLEINFALSYPNIDVRILAQHYGFAVVSVSLL